jgi:hypothetical protein
LPRHPDDDRAAIDIDPFQGHAQVAGRVSVTPANQVLV